MYCLYFVLNNPTSLSGKNQACEGREQERGQGLQHAHDSKIPQSVPSAIESIECGLSTETRSPLPCAPPPEPSVMSDTLFEAFEKISKQQNKEQVPPSQPHNKKSSSTKSSKKLSPKSAPTTATRRTLQEAFKAVSTRNLMINLSFLFFFRSFGLSQNATFCFF